MYQLLFQNIPKLLGVSVTKYGFSANRVSLAPNPQVTAIVLMPTVFPPIKSNLVSPTMTDWALGA